MKLEDPHGMQGRGASLCQSRAFAPLALTIIAFALVFCGLLFASQPGYAASGQVYGGTLQRCYKHPVSGVIEDSGGQKSYATGQGMVEGCLGSTCMMEQTSDGKYYLTIRLSLIDYTSKRSFKVQKWGASGWSNTTFGVTKKGKNTDGTTYDYCIQVPAKNAIVRMTMYVKPMGRSVVCYFYAKNLKAGKPNGWNATIVTSAGKVKNDAADTDASDSGKTDATADNKKKSAAQSKQKAATKNDSVAESASTDADSSDTSVDDSSGSTSGVDTTGAGVNSAQGLDLSTQSSSTSDSSSSNDNGNGMDAGQLFATVFGAVVAGGVVLIAIATGVLYYFRKHWAQWAPSDPDNYEQAYRASAEAAESLDHRPQPTSAERAEASLETKEPAVDAADEPAQIIHVDDAGVSTNDPTQIMAPRADDGKDA